MVVTNDFLELAAFSIYDPHKMIVMIMHGDYDYYYGLAAKHANIIDYFVASSKHMASNLRNLLPERSDTVLHLPYGRQHPGSFPKTMPRNDTARSFHRAHGGAEARARPARN